MFGKRRKAFLVSAALVGGALLMTACQDTEDGAAPSASATDVPAADAAGADASKGADKGAEQGAGQEPDAKDGGSAEGSGADAGDGTKVPVQQACGANDISWSTRSESQAGGYILIMAKAKQGITCILPAALPTVAFGSDGTEAGPAEQSVGDAVTLSGATTAYAGVNPKTTDTDGGKELDSIIVGVGNEDPDPVSLEVGTITVDKPVVTNWHTAPADAVPSA
ncbi:DUF4232 domain-containing protein [Streptomyces anulatus]|uniref:DUF4232 domain-containing protein n=1 Tax=Streptomyces anulatus TaxID=1892 RepID=UPI00067B48D9|nr:DUF4232 domain-containing protein [Streptomyces anulatus]KND29210.1 hypothetical protein IQ60_23240 [Streptomyces europaeiscabiei]KPL32309.1 hypothetical protein JI76_24990 [Streptomyces anulatus]WTC63362.1 DUF4232 domain-containing protein [Streptomyces anulatus]